MSIDFKEYAKMPDFRPYPSITPFTDRDGDTVASALQSIIKFLNDLIGSINEHDNALYDSVKKELEAAKLEVEAMLAAQTLANDEKIAALDKRVQDAVDTILNSSVEINDTAMVLLIADSTSGTSVALANIYARKDEVVTTVSGRKGDVVLTPADVGATTEPANGTIPLREASGRVPGVGTPTATGHGANKGYVDTTVTTAVEPVSANVEALESVVITADDVFVSTHIPGTRQGTSIIVDANAGHYNVFFVAPHHMEITGAWVVMGEAPNPVQESTTPDKHFDFVLRRFRTNSEAGQVVQVPVRLNPDGSMPVSQRKAFPLAGGVWNATNRILAPGDSLAFGVVISGGYVFKYPVAVTVKYRRIK